MVRVLASLVAIVVLACGGPRAASVQPLRPAPAAPLQAEVAPPLCRIEAARAETVTVAPAGAVPFEVSISDGALAFVPLEQGERRVGVEVEHPLRFSGVAPTDEQRLVVPRASDLAAGALHAVPGLNVLAFARTEAGLFAEVQLGRESPTTPHALELVIAPVPLSCEDVSAEPDAEPRVVASLPRRVTGGELRVATTLPLVLRPVRLAPARVEVRPRARGTLLPVWLVDRQSDEVRVVIPFSDGARVEGWVALAALREPSAVESELVERMVSAEVPEPFALAMLGVIESAPPALQPDELVGLASLRPGSPIFTEPGGPRWARSSEQPIEVRVRWQRGSSHAQLLELPGMWVPPEHAWVERGDVSIAEP